MNYFKGNIFQDIIIQNFERKDIYLEDIFLKKSGLQNNFYQRVKFFKCFLLSTLTDAIMMK